MQRIRSSEITPEQVYLNRRKFMVGPHRSQVGGDVVEEALGDRRCGQTVQVVDAIEQRDLLVGCLLYTSPSPRD